MKLFFINLFAYLFVRWRRKKNHIEKYYDRYSQKFDFIQASRSGDNYALYFICSVDITVDHGGKSDIINHAKTKKHQKNFEAYKSISKLKFIPVWDDFQTISAKLLFINFLLEHNIPLAAADHASSLLHEMFPNSAEVKKFFCGRTKTGQNTI